MAVGAAPVLTCGEHLRVHQLSYGQMNNFQYLLQSGDRAVIIDAAWDIEAINKYVNDRGLSLVGALYTHSHADHVGGSQFGSPSVPGAAEMRTVFAQGSSPLPLWIGEGDLAGATKATKVKKVAWTSLKEGEVVSALSPEAPILVIDTPGHTVGGVTFLVQTSGSELDGPCGDGLLFTGDTLFVEAAGRTDLPGGDPKTLLRSLSRLSQLPGRTVVMPGHSYGPRPRSSLRKELAGNNFLKQAVREFPPESLSPLPSWPSEGRGQDAHSMEGEL